MARQIRNNIKSTSFSNKDLDIINKVVDVNEHKSFADFMYKATLEKAKKELREIEQKD